MKNNFDKLDKHFPPTSWNETTAPFPDQHCIHQLFENCVHKYPAQDALIFEQDSMSYQELNQRSNQLAHYLRESGVKPETLVGIHIERSFDMIIAILAVFKAGGAYVPLDPNYPAERLAFILKDAQLTVCLTQQHLADKFSFKIKQSLNTICLDTHQHKIESYSIDNPVLHTTADNLAYVIYTSGSTGQPKGVLLEHRGLCNLATAQITAFNITAKMRILQFATLNFDASIWEIVMALSSGATLCLAKQENVLPAKPLLTLLVQQKINIVTLPPSILSLLPSEKLPDLNTIIVAGEACSIKIAKQWAAHTQFFNAYGPSETTVCASIYPVSSSIKNLPIGKPIINTQLFVLSDDLSVTAAGEVGELYIGGVNLARGYLHRAELTRTRFIQNPLKPTERLYRTGDLVRYEADGNLVFIGRTDDQVKIRGVRIELGEIEEILKQHSTITDAKVLVKGDSEENKHLVAYVASELVSTERLPLEVNCDLSLPDNPSVRYTSFTRDISCYGVCVKNTITKKMKKDQYINIELYLPKTKKGLALKGKVAWSSSHALGVLFDRPEKTNVCEKIQRLLEINGFTTFLQRTKSAHLRSFLQQRMPSYMMPANFVFFKKLPLTANGKIDKQALLQLDERPQQHKSNIAQKITTPTEVQVATVWKKALHLPEIDYEEDFIALGGHSLLAVKIANELSTLFHILLPFHTLLENPTIKQVSYYIDSKVNDMVNHHSTTYHQAIPSVGHHDYYPLSHYQQQLWLHAQLSNTVYNETSTIYFDQAIDTQLLEKALNLLLERHDALRSNFLIHHDIPVQKITPHHTFHLPVIDLRDQLTNKAVRIQQALKLATKDTAKAFSLENDLLLRALLIKISDTDYRLYLTMYHLIFDGDSLKNIFLPELEKIYTYLQKGKNIILPSLKSGYSDFSCWQRQQFNTDMLAPHLAYWRHKLTNLSDLQLPSDYPRSENAIFSGSTHCFKVNKRLTEQLKQLAKEEEVTLFMLLLTALKILIYRYTEETDIHVGTVIADDHPDMTEVMGYFLNTMIFRSDLSKNPVFTELLQQIKATTLEGYHHAAVPFDKLITELNPKRQLNTSYLSRIAFTVEPADVESKAGWSLSYLDVHTGQAKSDITIEMDETPQGFIGRIEYRTDLFKPETIECFAQHYTELLHSSVVYPHEHIDNLPLLPVTEQKKLLFQWNQTDQSYPSEHCIHEVFEECVLEHSNEIAVISEYGSLSYYELNKQANQLAHYLREQGVGLETFVGICVERSEKMIIAMLAVLKAGGAYIPMDASYPVARLQWMIEDSAMPVLVTQSSLNLALPTDTISTIIDLDSMGEKLTHYSPRRPKNIAHANSLAYVIYTSGSTGKPKGVLLEHQGLCNLVTAQIDSFNLNKNKKTLQFASFSFDASISECFTTLCSGATLYLFERNTIAAGEPLYQQLKQQGITTVTLTPSTLAHLPDKPLPDLETLVVAGEACPLPLMQKWADKCHFINAYGPTETTVCASLIQCYTDESQLTIGRPIANTQLYILNEALQPMPIGVTGELYIGGVGLARGYLNQSALSAQRFIKNPFPFSNSEYLYKTGDLAHYLADGRIVYHGRVDNQIKLRGHRIELGEIEAVLAQHPSVKEAIVNINTEQQLYAYLIAHPDIATHSTLSVPDKLSKELKLFLAKQLPTYMIPVAFIALDTIPLTTNGKVDKQALPAFNSSHHNTNTPFIHPRNAIEIQLLSLWETILKHDTISINDDFFELGGHSLLGVKLLVGIENTFQQKFDLSFLFKASTIEEQAIFIEQNVPLAESSLVPIQTKGHCTPFFCLPGVGGNVTYLHDLAKALGKEQPFYGLQSIGLQGDVEPLNTVEEIASHFIKEIQAIQAHGPYLIGGHSSGGIFAYEVAQQLRAKGEHIAGLIVLDVPVFKFPVDYLDWSDKKWFITVVMVLEHLLNTSLSITEADIKELTYSQCLSLLLQQMQHCHLLPENTTITQIKGIVNVLKVNELALLKYPSRNKPYHDIPVALCRTEEVYMHEDIDFNVVIPDDETWGWQDLTQYPVSVIQVEGGHTTMLQAPYVSMLAKGIKAYISTQLHSSESATLF